MHEAATSPTKGGWQPPTYNWSGLGGRQATAPSRTINLILNWITTLIAKRLNNVIQNWIVLWKHPIFIIFTNYRIPFPCFENSHMPAWLSVVSVIMICYLGPLGGLVSHPRTVPHSHIRAKKKTDFLLKIVEKSAFGVWGPIFTVNFDFE